MTTNAIRLIMSVYMAYLFISFTGMGCLIFTALVRLLLYFGYIEYDDHWYSIYLFLYTYYDSSYRVSCLYDSARAITWHTGVYHLHTQAY
jgi:hypothetical protein